MATTENSQNILKDNKKSEETEKKLTIKQMIDERSKKIQQQKTNMINNMTKQQMADAIYKQNTIIASQSSQLLELIALANSVEKDARSDEEKKCDAIKRKNDVCVKVKEIQNQQLMVYNTSTHIQIILFVLLLAILTWILYIALSHNKPIINQ